MGVSGNNLKVSGQGELEKAAFEYRLEGGKRVSPVDIQGRSICGGKRQCKGPEAETSLVCFKEQQGGHCGYTGESEEKSGRCVHRGGDWVLWSRMGPEGKEALR